MTRYKYILGLTIMFMANQSQAFTIKDCEPLKSTHPLKAKKYLKCLDNNLGLIERERETWINKIVMDMQEIEKDTGNTQLLPIILRSHKHQDRYIEDSCRWRYLHKMPNSTRAAGAYKTCKVRMLLRHIEDLKLSY